MLNLRALAPSLFFAAALISGCGSAEEDRPDGIDSSFGGGPGVFDGGCEGDINRDCSVTYEQANGTKSCFTGTQYCIDEKWSDCYESGYDPFAP